MNQRSKTKKTSVAGVIVASLCIIAYLWALITVIVNVNTSMVQYRLDAEDEFFDLARIAESNGMSTSFLGDVYNEIIQNELDLRRTLEGIIITGPGGGVGFDKNSEEGRAIHMVRGLPQFKNRLIFSRHQLFQHLYIEGVNFANIQAVSGIMDSEELEVILRQALLLVAAALVLAVITLILESLRKRGNKEIPAGNIKNARPRNINHDQDFTVKRSYSERSNVTREENTEHRLTEELLRCAGTGHDLAFIVMEYKPDAEEYFYNRFAADAARFFSSRDFICEKGEKGISVICPGLNLDTGFLNADEFHNRVIGKYPAVFKSKTDLCIGISARSERPVNAERLIFEAEEALERALMDPVSHIVAFKSDPDKYRAFIARQPST